MRALAAFVVLSCAGVPSLADDKPTQRGGTFIEPPAKVDRIYLPQRPNDSGTDAAGPVLQLRLGVDVPLRSTSPRVGGSTNGGPVGSPTLQALLRWQPLEDRRWFGQLGFLQYLRGGRQRPWEPDFTYSFGFQDPEPGSWSFFYANYSGTRLGSGAGADGGRLNFPQGQWTARRSFPLPRALEPLLLVGDGDAAVCNADANWMPRATTASGGTVRDKTSFALGCRYTRTDGFFAHFSALAWTQAQQPWDPDYTWGAGWSHPDGWTLQYANYSGNRWPGRQRAPGEGGLRGGSVSLSWTTAW